MKKIIILALVVLCAATASAQTNLFSAGMCHTSAPPTFNPGAKGCRLVLDTTTQIFYIWKIGTTWVSLGSVVDEVLGCAAPLYTPAKWQSDLAVNQCSPVPKLYKHVGAGVWECLNCTSSGSTDLTFSGGSSPYTLNSSTGADVTISAGANVTLTRVSNNLEIAASGGGGTVTTDATLDGDGSGGDPLKIAQQSAAVSEVLMWTGATWEPSWGNPNVFVTSGATITTDVNEVLIGTISGNVTMGLPTCNSTTDGKHFKFYRNGADAFSVTFDPAGGQQFYPATNTITQLGPVAIDCTCGLVSGTYFWFFDNF